MDQFNVEEFCREFEQKDADSAADFRMALEVHAEWNRDNNLVPIIEEAHRRGRERAPREQHVLVHPGYALDNVNLLVKGAYGMDELDELFPRSQQPFRDYRDRIHSLLSGDTKPFVVSYEGMPGAKATGLSYAKIPAARSVSMPVSPMNRFVSGFLPVAGIKRLIKAFDGIRPDDTVVLSGADMQQCVTAFAEQYIALSHFQQIHPYISAQPYPVDTSVWPITSATRRAFARGLWKMDLLKQSPVQFGTVFDLTNGLSTLPPHSPAMQLVKKEQGTIVYPQRKE